MIRAGSSNAIEEDIAQPNLTPLIDVVFMLIVFLLLTANAAQLVVTVDLPQASSAAPSDRKPLVLQPPLEAAEAWRLDGEIYENTGDLVPALKRALAADQDRVLVIAIDGAASSQRLIDAMDVANAAGAQAVEISAERRAE